MYEPETIANITYVVSAWYLVVFIDFSRGKFPIIC